MGRDGLKMTYPTFNFDDPDSVKKSKEDKQDQDSEVIDKLK
jgi:hypothetical protein